MPFIKRDSPFNQERYVLLDVTRAFARRWSGANPTGIDRVCDAYVQRYRGDALAVLQHRGIIRVLGKRQSDQLFDLLHPDRHYSRCSMLRVLALALFKPAATAEYAGKIYVNPGHTDFDLGRHWAWVQSRGLRTLYLIHDLIPINRPDLTRPHATRRHRNRIINALTNAHGLIANSASTASDLRHFASAHGLRRPPVLACHLGVDHVAMPEQALRHSCGHFVCVSTLEPRKNHRLLLNVWKTLIQNNAATTPKLVLIGQWGKQSSELHKMLRDDSALAQRVTVLERCADPEMAYWVRTARAVLLPSAAEGYGFPLAEAMALGTPVIASDLPCFREIGAKVPLFIPPTDAAAWLSAITQLLNDGREAKRQIGLLAQHRSQTWANHFRVVDEWIASRPDDDTVTGPLCRQPLSASFTNSAPVCRKTC